MLRLQHLPSPESSTRRPWLPSVGQAKLLVKGRVASMRRTSTANLGPRMAGERHINTAAASGRLVCYALLCYFDIFDLFCN